VCLSTLVNLDILDSLVYENEINEWQNASDELGITEILIMNDDFRNRCCIVFSSPISVLENKEHFRPK